jgi:hypothetical protein
MWRSVNGEVSDIVMLMFTGMLIGALFPSNDVELFQRVSFLVVMAVGITVTMQSLRLFGRERVVFWRESSAGINRLSYFIGKSIAALTYVVIFPLALQALFFSGLRECLRVPLSRLVFRCTRARTSLNNRHASFYLLSVSLSLPFSLSSSSSSLLPSLHHRPWLAARPLLQLLHVSARRHVRVPVDRTPPVHRCAAQQIATDGHLSRARCVSARWLLASVA